MLRRFQSEHFHQVHVLRFTAVQPLGCDAEILGQTMTAVENEGPHSTASLPTLYEAVSKQAETNQR